MLERTLLRHLLDHLPGTVVLVADTDLRLVHVSDPGVRLGWAPGDLVGRELATLLADRPVALAQFAAALDGVATTTSYRSLNGERDYDLRVTPLRCDGAVDGVMSVATDVTERATADRELRTAKDEFESAFANAPIGFALVAPDGSWLRVNRSLTELLGYTEEELFGTTFQDVTHPDDLDADLGYVERMLAGEIGAYSLQKRYIAKNGEIVPAMLSVSLVRDETGEPLHFISQVQDWRSEVRRRELEQEVADRRRTDSLEALAGGVAHDFNNLLQAVRGYAVLALERVDDDQARRYLATIEQAATEATDLSLKMLQYAGRHSLELEPVDLSRIAHDACAGEDVELRLARDLPPVRGDVDQLALVPLHLVRNAVEAAGAVVVSTGAVNGCVFLDVADDGHGMDPETRERMFEPFFTTRFPGRGLGLAAVDGIVRGHGGRIEVETAPGAGTRVRVLLPAAA